MSVRRAGIVAAVANQKGGVSKTTTTFCIMFEFAETLNLKTLVIDWDPQGTLTSLLNIPNADLEAYNASGSICNVFERKDVNIMEYSKNLDVILSDKKLSDCFYASISCKDLLLKKFLDKVKYDYDIILIDTKPDLNTPLVSAIIASDIIINTIGTGGIEENATVSFYDKLEETVDIYDLSLKKIFVIPTLLDNSIDSKDALLSIKNTLPELYNTKYTSLRSTPMKILKALPRRAVIKNATGHKMPIRQYIKEADSGKKDILLDLESLAKKIWKGAIS